jgi:hypothetical protein
MYCQSNNVFTNLVVSALRISTLYDHRQWLTRAYISLHLLLNYTYKTGYVKEFKSEKN